MRRLNLDTPLLAQNGIQLILVETGMASLDKGSGLAAAYSRWGVALLLSFGRRICCRFRDRNVRTRERAE